MKKSLGIFFALFFAFTLGARSQEKLPLKLVATTPLPDFTGDFDHFAVDLKGKRLFLTAEDHKTVEVFDLEGKRIHSITGFGQPHAAVVLADSNIIVTDRVDKVIEIDATSLLAIAGVPATAFEMARVLQTSFEYYRRSQLQTLSLPAKVRALARLLRDNLPMAMQGVGVVVPLFAGLDQSVTPARPQIFFYDPLGAQFQAVDYAASLLAADR